jgi:hypothetical protein
MFMVIEAAPLLGQPFAALRSPSLRSCARRDLLQV